MKVRVTLHLSYVWLAPQCTNYFSKSQFGPHGTSKESRQSSVPRNFHLTGRPAGHHGREGCTAAKASQPSLTCLSLEVNLPFIASHRIVPVLRPARRQIRRANNARHTHGCPRACRFHRSWTLACKHLELD